MEDLFSFWGNHTEVYLIVDQLNALEQDSRSPHPDPMKVQATSWLNRLSVKHPYIFSASANERTYQEADEKQNATTVVKFHGGMTEVCQSFNLVLFYIYNLGRDNGMAEPL
jgi:hypothetical protein